MLGLSLMLAATLVADAPAKTPAADDYVGRWNVRITDPDTQPTFVAGGFKVERKDGGLAGSVVWRWGSNGPAKVTVADGALHLVREEEPGKPDAFEARLEGALLKGEVKYADGKIHHFEGKRAPELATKGNPKWGAPVTLFDGKTLGGWKLRDASKKMGWGVVDGDLAVVNPDGNADLVTEKSFQDLKLHIEFNVEPHSNSGVYLRGRYEVQIEAGDPHSTAAAQKCGSLYSRIAPSLDATKPAGEWQAFDITFVGRKLTVVLNGKTIIDGAYVDGITGGAINTFEGEPGPLMLQGDHGKVRFRNVVLTPAR
jgi:hypothetical protein